LPTSTTKGLDNLLAWRWLFAEDPTVIGLKTGRLMSTLRYTCPDTEHLPPLARASYLGRLHEVLAVLDEGWALDSDWWHEPAPEYPAGAWQQPVEWLVDESRRMDFVTHPRHLSTAYLTLTWTPPKATRQWLRDIFLTRTTGRRIRQALDEHIALFQGGLRRWAGLLAPVIETLHPLDGDAIATYLHQCISWDRQPVHVDSPAWDLDWQLGDTAWVPGQPPRLGGLYVQPLTIKNWRVELSTWLPEALAKLPFPCRLHLRWMPMGAKAASHFLWWEEKRWAGSYRRWTKTAKQATDTDAPSEVQGRDYKVDAIRAGKSIIAVQTEVMLGQDVLGMLTPTLLCWAETLELLDARVQALQAVLFQHGLVARVEEANASNALVASWPGHTTLGIRGRPLRATELAGVMAHSSVWPGRPWNHKLQGPAVMVLSTDGNPFYFDTQDGENRHSLIVGPTRSGKSGLVGLKNRQWFRYPRARLAIFDLENAHKVSTLLCGGAHYALGTPGCSGFHPLGRVDQPQERTWAETWLEHIFEGEGLAPTPDERHEIREGLQRLASLAPPQRTMSMARRLIQVQRLKVGLEPFCAGGTASFFDASEDAFSLQARLVCFEMETIRQTPRAIGPCLDYIIHRLETEWFTGDPVEITVEEARWIMDLERFLGSLEIWLKARAKKNVSVSIICQEIYDMHRTTAWQAIQGSIKTRIFLPNPAALSDTVKPFYLDMQCTEDDLAMIAQGQPFQDYLFVSPQGKRRFQLRLSPWERLNCAASTLEEIAVAEQLMAEVGQVALPVAWQQHWRYHEEAGLLLEAATRGETNHDDSTGVDRSGSAPHGNRGGRDLLEADDTDADTHAGAGPSAAPAAAGG
jgi:type IV secretion system protein TrbE